MRSRKHWKKEVEAKFLANTFKELAEFSLRCGFPIAAYLLGLAQLDVAEGAQLPQYLALLELQGLACRWPEGRIKISAKTGIRNFGSPTK